MWLNDSLFTSESYTSACEKRQSRVKSDCLSVHIPDIASFFHAREPGKRQERACVVHRVHKDWLSLNPAERQERNILVM